MTDATAPGPHASRARRVALFEDRAEVVRGARVALREGVQWVALAGATVLLDDDSLQARVAGEQARVLAARVVRHVHHEPASDRAETDALERAARDAGQAAARATQALARAATRETRAAQLLAQWTVAVADVPRGTGDATARAAAAWREAYAALDREATAAAAATADARAAVTHAEDAHERAQVRLREGLRVRPRYEAVLEVQLHADAPHAAELEVTYRVPCALWRPEHLARLTAPAGPNPTEGTVEIVTYATAWQATGEVWEDVAVRFSTARPARAATPPPVADDVLYARRKTDEEKHTVVVEAREQAIAVAGLTRGTRAVDEMPGVDDGGEPLAFEPAVRVTLASDGLPFRVEIARATVPAALARVLYPERAPAAHLRATATLAHAGPLLAGPVRLARDSGIVGRARLDFVGRGEPFELGFGADDSVRVRRVVADERDTGAILGKQTLKRTVKVHLSNLSSDARRIEVVERVPVSEIEDVQVALLGGEGWRLDTRDGFAKTDVELGPNATRTLALTYEVRASGRVRMPF